MIAAAELLVPANEEEEDNAKRSIDAGEVSAGTEMRPPPKITTPATTERKTWTATIDAIVQQAGRMTYDELREEISQTPLGKTLARTDKSFYGAVGKLAGQGRVVRHKGWIYSGKTYAQLKRDIAAGRAVDEEAPRTNPAHYSPFGEAIKTFMDSKPEGAQSSEIIRELRKTPDFAETMDRHKSHFYNVLSRLVEQGELAKGGNNYFRAPNKLGGQG